VQNYPEDKFNKLDMLKRHKKYTCYIPKYQDVSNEQQDEDQDQKFEPYLVPLLSNCLRKVLNKMLQMSRYLTQYCSVGRLVDLRILLRQAHETISLGQGGQHSKRR